MHNVNYPIFSIVRRAMSDVGAPACDVIGETFDVWDLTREFSEDLSLILARSNIDLCPMALELDNAFRRREGVPIGVEDIRLGLSLALISPPTAFAAAGEALDRGSTDATLIEMAQTDEVRNAIVREGRLGKP